MFQKHFWRRFGNVSEAFLEIFQKHFGNDLKWFVTIRYFLVLNQSIFWKIYLYCIVLFQSFFNGLLGKLKQEGYGSTAHHDEIDEESQRRIEDLLVLLQTIMETKKDDPKYKELIKKLPVEWRSKYHYLIQWGAQYLLMLHTAKRGREVNIHSFTLINFLEMFLKRF